MDIPLLKLMTADVAEQREDFLSSAKREADEIEARAKKTGEARHNNAIAIVDSELQAMAKRSRGRIEAESHMVLMTTKDTITDELLATLEKELSALAKTPEFTGILESLLGELMPDGPAEGVVLAPKAHVEQCQQWLEENGYKHRAQGVSFLTDGVAVEDSQGSFRVTNTLSARFEKQKSALRKQCIEKLFDKGAQA